VTCELVYEELMVHVLIPSLVEKAKLLFIMIYVILILLTRIIIHQKRKNTYFHIIENLLICIIYHFHFTCDWNQDEH